MKRRALYVLWFSVGSSQDILSNFLVLVQIRSLLSPKQNQHGDFNGAKFKMVVKWIMSLWVFTQLQRHSAIYIVLISFCKDGGMQST